MVLVLSVNIPCMVVAPFVVTFRDLVPVCACSVLLLIISLPLFLVNPVVFSRVSVPVCWLGVRSSGWLCMVSVSVAMRLIVSLLYPVALFTVMLVGVSCTVRLLVQLLAAKMVSPVNSAVIWYVPGFCVVVYCSVAIPLLLVLAVPTGVPSIVKVICLFMIGLLCVMSVRLAIRLVVSLVYPSVGVIVMWVGV